MVLYRKMSDSQSGDEGNLTFANKDSLFQINLFKLVPTGFLCLINVIAVHRHCAHKEVPADREVLVLKGTVFTISQWSPKERQAEVFSSKGSRTPILV